MSKVKDWVKLARPHQYLKNGFVWLPLFFGYKLEDPQAVLQTICAFVVFCLAASSIYIINDMKDIAEDRQHPVKRFRPMASGKVKRFEAFCIFFIFMFLAVLLSLIFLPVLFLIIIGGYILLNFSYSFLLKHLTIIDVACIAIGFVLRIIGGGIAADIQISPWIIIMTFLLALFLALAKRRDDLLLAEDGHSVRKSLDGYNMEFVSLSMVVMASVIIVSYVLYTVSPEIIEKHGTSHMYLSSFWVILGLLRYMQIVFVEQRSGSPTLVLVSDYFLQCVIILWLMSIYFLLYGL